MAGVAATRGCQATLANLTTLDVLLKCWLHFEVCVWVADKGYRVRFVEYGEVTDFETGCFWLGFMLLIALNPGTLCHFVSDQVSTLVLI